MMFSLLGTTAKPLFFAFLLFAFLAIKRHFPGQKGIPGPRGQLVFGSLLQLRAGHARALARWTKQYGGIFRLFLGNREAIFLNTYSAVAQTLFEQGAAFQSRPEFTLWHGAFSKALDKDAPSTIGTMEFSENVKRFRRLLYQFTSATKLQRYDRFALARYFRLMSLLSEASSKTTACDLGYHIWTTTIGISAEQLLGYSVDEEKTRSIAEGALAIFRQRNLGFPMHDFVPSIALMEKFSIRVLSPVFKSLRFFGIAAWLDSFQDTEIQAAKLRQAEIDSCQELLQEFHQRLEKGDNTPSILGDLVRGLSEPLTSKEEFTFMTTLVASGMAGGSTLVWLMGKLATLPEMQDTAFEAIKAIYGDQFPDPLDTDRVEYIKALGIEAGRVWSSIRLGFYRQTCKDVVVNGIFIPKGMPVIYNSFQINRDPQRYDSPEEFIPERWMNGHYGRMDTFGEFSPKIGVPHLTHGVGQRICLGISSTNKMFYGVLVLILSSFKLELAPLPETSKAEIFPSFRIAREASAEMDPIKDQLFICDAQALPGYFGIKLTPRDPEALATWLAGMAQLLESNKSG